MKCRVVQGAFLCGPRPRQARAARPLSFDEALQAARDREHKAMLKRKRDRELARARRAQRRLEL
ncbi:MAG: hypothetical protein OXB97_04545 [Rhodospirillales bacterium]|nr:hypothetical protein [Rhodospirillales bacterium]